MTDAATPTSTRRLGLDAAPDGLAIAQDLLNTAAAPAVGVPDLLADLPTARRSLEASLRLWAEQTGSDAPEPALGESDLVGLRELRDELRRWLIDPTDGLRRATTIAVTLGGGTAAYAPEDGVAGLVVTELLIASRTGRLRRLKTCANQACGAAFYDGSPNASRVWHDVRTCGNAFNLRASRARRRAPSA